MLTIRAATSLLANATSLDALAPIARALGFESPLLPLSPDALATLGLSPYSASAHLGQGIGHLRLVAAELLPPTADHAATDARELTRRLCTALARNAPARLWCAITIDPRTETLCIACVTPHPTHTHTPRITALRIERHHIVDSDADTLRALASAPRDHDRLAHARWSDILQRDALSARFYRTLDRLVRSLAHSATHTAAGGASGGTSSAERHELALLCASRLLFLAFLEAKGWLDNDRGFLLTHCARLLESGGRLHERLLKPLFFGTLNTPVAERARAARAFGTIPFLNGGLFSPTALERRRRALRFSDDAITALIGELLDRFRFTAREDSSTWSEAAVDPEMLGRAFECLMASDERRRSGSFYTPPQLVEQTVDDALRTTLPDLPIDPSATLPADLASRIRTLHVLDPACGSGAFLVHMLERLAALHQQLGDPRPLHTIRRDVLTASIFGVDRNPLAVWLCELRLWLSVVIECPETHPGRIPPLPNLDHHIHAGDSLDAGDLRFASPSRGARKLTQLRTRYTRATGTRKRTLGGLLEHEERDRAIAECTRRLDATNHERRDLLARVRQRDLFGQRPRPSRADTLLLRTLRQRATDQRHERRQLILGAALPFRFATHFADVGAGFDIVIGNPPWVRPHNLPLAERARLRREYQTLRHAAWKDGATRAGAGAGFAAQADLSAAFVERSIELLRPDGTLALLLPAKLWRALAGGGVRKFVAHHTRIATVRDWSDAHALFDAAVYPSLLVATRHATAPANIAREIAPAQTAVVPLATSAPPSPPASAQPSPPSPTLAPHAIHVTITRHHTEHTFTLPPHSLAMGADPAAPWLLLPPAARHTFELLRHAGPALGDSTLGRPLLGVKCGCNAAFLVHATEHDDDSATIECEGRAFTIERTLLRPALRGDGIAERTPHPRPHMHATRARGARTSEQPLRILWTHGPDGTPLRSLPPRTSRWLARYRPRLESRRDARARQPWWTLFRTEAARHEGARLVWADLGRRLRTVILAPGDPTVPLNTCYVLRTPLLDDAYALNALLSSPLAGAWLDSIAEPARGGWRRFLGWTVAALPVPADWITHRPQLADVGRRLSSGIPVPAHEQLSTACEAYGIRPETCAPLLDWCAR